MGSPRATAAKRSLPAIMWRSSVRTSNSAQGVGRASCSGRTFVTIASVISSA